MRQIEKGDAVRVEDWRGQKHGRRAISPAVRGHDFVVVWICREEEWEAARSEGREPQGMPWPEPDVEPA